MTTDNDELAAKQEQLAKKYSPVLVVYPEIKSPRRDDARNRDWRTNMEAPIKEDYYPRDINLMLDHSWTRRRFTHDRERLLEQMANGSNIPRIKYKRGAVKPRNAWESYFEILQKQGDHADEEYPNTTYAHFVEGEKGTRLEGLMAIQYWFFYYYNDWRASHAGDWEHIVVVLKDSPQGEVPYACAYSAHHGGYRLDWRNVQTADDDGLTESEGGKQGGTHPVVYVASGSHANYYYGSSKYVTTTEVLGKSLTTDKLPFGGEFSDFTVGKSPESTILPIVKVVPESDNGKWTGEWRWLNFNGRWGSTGADLWDNLLSLFRKRKSINDAPGSLPERSNWIDPFYWINHQCIDPLPPTDDWLNNDFYLRPGIYEDT